MGDSPFDLQAARAAGMGAIAVGWGVFDRAVLEAQRPDRYVRDLGELAVVLGLRSEVVRES